MNINDIMAQMKVDMTALSLPEIAIGGLAVTVLSMAIVFAVLAMLMYLIKIMTKVMVKPEKTVEVVTPIFTEQTTIQVDNSEEIAAIMAAISAISGVGENRLIIRNITPVGESNWGLQGRISQIGNRI